MPNTSKSKPVLVIVVAIILAGIAALYLSKEETAAESKSAGTTASAAATSTEASTPGRIRGAADAPVTLTEYGDYQCPTCGVYHPITQELLSRYQGKLKLEFRHYPLVSSHPHAMAAALAAEAAGDQGKFWEMHDMIFEHQNDWSRSPNAAQIFLQYAVQIGLDTNRYMQAVKSPETQSRVLADVTRGNAFVQGTPTFLINGQVLHNLPNLEGLSDLIAGQLKAIGK
jgi:protein-disulfide isomerase